MHRFAKGKNVASVLKYHSRMWYNFAMPHFAVPNFAPANPPPPPPYASMCETMAMLQGWGEWHTNGL